MRESLLRGKPVEVERRGSWVVGRGWILLIGVNELLGGLSHYCDHAW